MSARSMLLAVLVLVVASTACQPPVQEEASGALSDADIAAIEATLEAHEQAGLAGDWESFFALFTEDAVLMVSNRPAVEGLEAIKGWGPWVRAIEWEMSIVEIDGRGDLAFARGTDSYLLDYEGAVKEEGKFLYILRKQPDGSWRIATWLASSDLPLPEQGSGTEQ